MGEAGEAGEGVNVVVVLHDRIPIVARSG